MMMKRSRVLTGLLVLGLAGTTSAFTSRSGVDANDQLWFDPGLNYSFQFFGTTVEALDYFYGYLSGSTVASEGFLYSRRVYPPTANPFAKIEYDPYWGEPTYGSELNLNENGDPTQMTDTIIYYE